MTKRFEANSIPTHQKLTKRLNVFCITGNTFNKTAKAIYHNAEHNYLKLSSYKIIPEKIKKPLITKRFVAVSSGKNNNRRGF